MTAKYCANVFALARKLIGFGYVEAVCVSDIFDESNDPFLCLLSELKNVSHIYFVCADDTNTNGKYNLKIPIVGKISCKKEYDEIDFTQVYAFSILYFINI